MLRGGRESPSPVPRKPRHCPPEPLQGHSSRTAPGKGGPRPVQGRSHLHLSSSRWSSQPSPGPAPPRCPLCHAGLPRQHCWGHSPDKGEQISPSPSTHSSPAPLPRLLAAIDPSPTSPGSCHPHPPGPTQLSCTKLSARDRVQMKQSPQTLPPAQCKQPPTQPPGPHVPTPPLLLCKLQLGLVRAGAWCGGNKQLHFHTHALQRGQLWYPTHGVGPGTAPATQTRGELMR